LKITDVAFGGNGLGRHEGKVVFVPAVLPGETVKVEIFSDRKNFSFARLLDVIEQSEDRIEPLCPFAVRAFSDKGKSPAFCPGCSYQHIRYEKELELKNKQFEGFISKACKGICPVPEISKPFPSPGPMNYRNKIMLNVYSDGSCFKMGYFMDDNSTIIDIPQCLLARKEINQLLSEKRSDSGFPKKLQNGTKVTFRYTEHDGTLFIEGGNTSGKMLKEKTVLGLVSVPLSGFFQINAGGMNKLISMVQDIITEIKPETVIDLYCGAGIFSLAAAAEDVPGVIGIDWDKNAIGAAALNAESLGLHCRFLSGDVGSLADGELRKTNPRKTLLILDPPRTGLDKKLIVSIENTKIKSIVYISCGPDTLGRDLKILLSKGYRIKNTGLIDMFPRTYHFESLTYLERD
jgi:23S rRNA (uracil1939-C5)-methyltransferase